MRAPLVSVCVPTRDRAGWLGEALDSVFRQTLEDFEIVVFDDASRDGTRELVTGRADPRLRYHRHDRAVGVAANRNACLTVARGRYIAWLDSDDRYGPEMLATQCEALSSHPSAVLAHGGFHVIDAAGERLPDFPQAFSEDRVEPATEAFAELVTHNYVTAPTVVVRRAAYDAVGGYRRELETGEDWDMWLRLARVGDFVYRARALAEYRWHPASLARSAWASGRQLRRDLRVLDGVLEERGGAPPGARAHYRRGRAALAARALRLSTDCLTRGERRGCVAAAAFALRAAPALLVRRAGWRLLSAAVRGDEYAFHVAQRQALGRLVDELRGSRVGERLRRQAVAAPEWEKALLEVAAIVRRVVPPAEAVAVVDKWDPTVLHLSRRRGWHFPDRRALPEGYPKDSELAIRHLEEQRLKGARFLVLPSGSLWWLDHYGGLARHLESEAQRVWADERCVIYQLAAKPSVRAA